MAALRLVRKWGIPLATAAGAPLLVPVVRAEGGEGAKESPPPPPTSRMVRPSDLPIYEEPEEVLDFEYIGRERTSLEEGVGVVRKEVEGIMEATRSARERIVHIYETGKAHSMATVDYLTDEENMLPRAGAITVGGLAGLVIGARRRGGFIRKVLYTSTGVLTAASLCYPRQAYAISQQVYAAAKDYGAIGYNFVVGVKPQSKAPPPPPPPEAPKEPEKEAEKSATPATEEAPPAPTPTEPQGAEVRSATALSLPPGKNLIDTLAEQASDVTVWGFRLTDKGGTAASKATKPSVPEGFGSVGTAEDGAKVVLGKGEAEHLSQAKEQEKEVIVTPAEGDIGSLVEEVVETVKEGAAAVVDKVAEVEEKVEEGIIAVGEKVAEVEEKVEEGIIAVGEKVAEVEEKASTAVVEVLTPVLGEEEAREVVEKVETVVGEAVEKVGEMVGGKVAVVVEEAAREVEETAAVVEEAVQTVEETGEGVEKALDVVERVTEAVEGAAEKFPAVPVAEVDKVEKVMEEAEAVVESITEAAKEVEGVTEEVRKEAQKVEEEAAKVMESEEKRKEVLEEVVEALEAKEKQDAAAVVPQVTPAAPQEKEGLFDKLVSFFKPDKDAVESTKEQQADKGPAEVSEILEDAKKEVVAEAQDKLIPSPSVTQETQGTEILISEAKPEPELPASPELRVVTAEATGGSEPAEKPEVETDEKVDSGTVVEAVGEMIKTEKIEEEKEQLVEEAAGWVMVEMEKEEAVVEKSASSEGKEGAVKEETPVSEALPTVRKEGLFDQLVRLFTKDEEKPVSSGDVVVPPESVPAGAGEVPLPGEEEGKELSSGTLVREDEVLPVAHGDILVQEDAAKVPDVSVIPEGTAQGPQVVEDTIQIADALVPDNTAQTPSLPADPVDTPQAPEVTAQVPDVTELPTDTDKSLDVPDLTHTQVTVASTEAEREPAGTLGSEAESASGYTPEEPPPPPPLPVEKKNMFDKLISLFQKEEQQLEPQLHETAVEKVKVPVTEPQEPVAEVKEGPPAVTDQVSDLLAGETLVPESSQEELSSVAPAEDVSPVSPSEPAMEQSAPTGSDVPETVVVVTGGKEEEETALAAAAETTQLPQVSIPQVQSPSGSELEQQPFSQVSGEAPVGVAAADTQAGPSTQAEEGLPATQSLTPPEAAEDQVKAREPGTEPHVVEAEGTAAAADLATDKELSEDSQIDITSQGDTFIVRASPNRPSGVEVQGEDRRQAGAALRPGWLRTEGDVVQEGKDVIVKLEPPTPEKDFGQSNPEDSDMYTTRG